MTEPHANSILVLHVCQQWS